MGIESFGLSQSMVRRKHSNSTWNDDERRKDTIGFYPNNNGKQQSSLGLY